MVGCCIGSICYMQSQTRYMNGQLPSTDNKITPAWDMVFLAGGLVSMRMMFSQKPLSCSISNDVVN
jgi:hypothetical protein